MPKMFSLEFTKLQALTIEKCDNKKHIFFLIYYLVLVCA